MRLIAMLLYRLRLSPLLRRLGVRVPWTFEEIERQWFGSAHLHWDRADVEAAFNLATKMRGHSWVLAPKRNMKPFAPFPDIGPRGGYSEFLRGYWFGARMASIVNAPGADDLAARVIAGDADGDEEATAIHLLRSRHPEADLEIEPCVKVGARERKPDFRVRGDAGPWVYVEVTRLHQSAASARVQALLARLVDQVIAVSRPFVLELLLNREPTEAEEEALVIGARRACEAAEGHRTEIG